MAPSQSFPSQTVTHLQNCTWSKHQPSEWSPLFPPLTPWGPAGRVALIILEINHSIMYLYLKLLSGFPFVPWWHANFFFTDILYYLYSTSLCTLLLHVLLPHLLCSIYARIISLHASHALPGLNIFPLWFQISRVAFLLVLWMSDLDFNICSSGFSS